MTIALLILLVVLVFLGIGLYNRLVKLRNNRENAFADIDVQLKQRLDLIPQLVEAVKAYMKHESTVLTDITNARSKALEAQSISEKIEAGNQLSAALQGLKVAVEAYPDLKASQNFIQLQEEIADIENKLAAARRFFNSATKELNNAVETFPSNIVAGAFNFEREVMYDLGADQRATSEETPKLNF
ncbi:MAG: LemA family protein [Bacteroidales bacterium]|nr:LemA family protein [Bacteroidales bacterium]MBN2763178.1 LemA family protein [Bacteroidales bacterium]